MSAVTNSTNSASSTTSYDFFDPKKVFPSAEVTAMCSCNIGEVATICCQSLGGASRPLDVLLTEIVNASSSASIDMGSTSPASTLSRPTSSPSAPSAPSASSSATPGELAAAAHNFDPEQVICSLPPRSTQQWHDCVAKVGGSAVGKMSTLNSSCNNDNSAPGRSSARKLARLGLEPELGTGGLSAGGLMIIALLLGAGVLGGL